MANTINADNGVVSGFAGVRTTADGTGNLALQSNGNTVLTLNTANAATFAGTVTATGGFINGANTAPTCSVYAGAAQNITSSSSTIIQATVKLFDTNGCFNNTSSAATLNGISVPAWAFLPNIAGYYQVNVQTIVSSTTGINEALIYKNGATVAYGPAGGTDGGNILSAVSQIIYCNGTSDYIQYAVYQTSGSTKGLLIGSSFNIMSIAMVRSA